MNSLQDPNKPSNLHSHDHFSRRRNLKDLLHLKGDDSGYIEGKVFMIWPPRNKLHRINLEVAEDSALYRFELEVLYKDGIAFRPHERICFALKGMKVNPRKESSAPHYFPIVLRYPDGVVLKYLSGSNAGKVIDTWAGNADEWYNPGMVHTVSDAVTIDASDIANCHGEGTKVHVPPPPVAVTDGAAAAQSMQPAQQPSTKRPGEPSKMKPRKRRKLKRGQEPKFPEQPANGTDRLRQADVATPCHEQPHTAINGALTSVSDNHPKFDQLGEHANGEASVLEDSNLLRENNRGNATIISGDVSVPALQLKAGIRTQRGDTFTALSDLQKTHFLINVIGIVASVNPERKTKTNEWSRSFTLVDSSTVDSPRQGVTVNCFQKKYPEWLPQVQKDDIVILRKLKIVEYNGVVAATGYGDKLRWAVYDPLKHSIRPPSRGNAPEKESIDDGLGYEFSPYWEPFQDSVELEYCRQVREWWKAKHERGGVSTVVCSASPSKRHLLISEASPDLPPKGFFNCTVEVLQKFNNGGGAAIVYVTDYTTNPSVHTVEGTWCPHELSDRILQCNMWDDAKEIAEIMNPGEYWYLHNIRARWNPSHYMEGTMQLAEKVTQLDETKPEAEPHLKALLARKKEFELNKSFSTSSSYIFPHMLIQDVEASTSFLTCVVELLHIDLDSRDGHFMYVTDYTYNPDLPTTVSSTDWAYNLDHRVLKIKLDDTQAKISSNIKPGSMYTVCNLRIKRSSVSSGVHGYLGGEDTLIVSLHDLSNQHTQVLQSNKERWKRENMLNVPTMSHGEPRELLSQSSTTIDYATLQEILAKPAPNVFTTLARAVDFWPNSLEDACVLRCSKCGSRPPPSFKRCPRCDDMMETHSEWSYCMYIQLQDEKDGELIVSLSGKECTLLQDVDATDFRCDHLAFRKFLAKLDPILGNLRDVHDAAWSINEHKVIESPPMMFTLESWNIDGKKGYSLLGCTPPAPMIET